MSKKTFVVCTSLRGLKPNLKSNKVIIPAVSAIENSEDKKFYKPELDYINYYSSNKKLILKDAIYLNNFYEHILKRLSIILNKIHKENNSIRFWRILIGPWLGMLLHIYYSKWKTVNLLNKKKFNFYVNFVNTEKNSYVPIHTQDFRDLTKKEIWNQILYQKIFLHFLPEKRIKKINVKYDEKIIKTKSIKAKIINFFGTIFYGLRLWKFNNYFIINSYLGHYKELLLNIKLFQLPVFNLENNFKVKNFNYNYKLRNKIKLFVEKNKKINKFEKNFIEDFVTEIPYFFLENYNLLKKNFNKLHYPKNPKIIFSSNFMRDVLLSFYIGKKVENGTKLIMGQHGGIYGTSLYSWFEKHELKISDKYLNWGWSNSKYKKKIIKTGVLAETKNIEWKEQSDDILIILKRRKKYLTSFVSGDSTESYFQYINHYNNFLKEIPKNLKSKIVLRFPPTIKDIKLEDCCNIVGKDYKLYNKGNLFKSMENSKLVVNTFDSTPFLLAMAINFPNIILWNLSTNPIKDKNLFNKLYKAKILHFSPVSAAKFVSSLVDKNEIKKWWFNKKTQNVREKFCNKYAKENHNLLSDIIKNFNKK
tara:strand:+ start:773 stop:2539 length:1767 start_codon:yes stop_codon:yes gene_type:complete